MNPNLSVKNITNEKGKFAKTLFSLIKKIYNSSNSFCDSFQEKYPSFDFFTQELENSLPHSIYLGAFSEKKLIGYLILSPQQPVKLRHTSFFTMGVDPEYRGKGIGKVLIEKLFEERNSCIEIIYLMVRADNLAAIKLYENFEFSKIALLKNDTKINSEYFDGVMMSRSFIGK